MLPRVCGKGSSKPPPILVVLMNSLWDPRLSRSKEIMGINYRFKGNTQKKEIKYLKPTLII